MKNKTLVVLILISLFEVLSAKPKRELRILIDDSPDAEFELELWQEKPLDEEAVSKNTPEVIEIKGNKITVTPKDEFDYFRIRRIGQYGAKGFWTQVYSTNVDPSSPLSVPKEYVKPKTIAKVEPPKTKASVISEDSFVLVKEKEGREAIRYLTKNSITILPSDEGSGISEVRYKVNDGNWTSSKASATVNFNEEGNYKFLYFALDQVGNKEPTQMIFFTKDSTPPQTEVIWLGISANQKGKPSFISGETKLQLVTKDNLSGVARTFYAYACNEGVQSEFLNYDTPITVYEIKTKCNGGFKLFYYGADNVGNEEPVKLVDFQFQK